MVRDTTTPDSGAPRSLMANFSRQRDELVVSLQSELDIVTADGLVAGAIIVAADDLVVDLAAVRFIDAAAIGVLIRCRVLLRLQSRDLTLRGPSAWVERVPGICGLADVVAVPSSPALGAGSRPADAFPRRTAQTA
jgi:anti-anti-sigma factor